MEVREDVRADAWAWPRGATRGSDAGHGTSASASASHQHRPRA
jgi:hypothetical protein